MFEEIPVEVGLVHEGERVRKNDMQVELGGPNEPEKCELVRVRPLDSITDGDISIVGPDIGSMEEGKHYPLGILVEVAGARVEPDLEGVIERRIHEYSNYIEGFMHLNQRYDIWIRLSKKSFRKGLNTFRYIGKVMLELFRNELPILEKVQITFITDPEKLGPLYREALAAYDARDARARGLSDKDVDVFYGCALCQSFAPTHICVITPQRYANCGAISWFDGRAAAGIDPKGPIYAIEKGECIDPEKGEYSGVNESAKKRSMGEISRVFLYSAFGYPHTSCGCFEGIAFYIPEADGFGVVLRGFRDVTVNGLPFSTMADSTAGGRQVDGFHGISIEYMRSPQFLHADGGYDRVVWMPAETKERLKDFIPASVFPSIATEKDVTNIPELKAFLESRNHPVVQRWTAAEQAPSQPVVVSAGDIPITANGYRIILKNARITAEKVIIVPVRATDDSGGDLHGAQKK
ncbi:MULTISPECIES: CO dehydrogenase/CO-methylating acetyl-CoA synthase complex subunit beta [unclassified Methanoregula]|uniref:CO dehydrogenase/CO-methylating acetyl-CoA synthase complex subunit beta n=1 Tax=unclassified Methanoregula TaxID=2649730 RepID=UPI0009C7CD83|nr:MULTISPECIES: CO dehydrogenase/CO-methylating acetyl-CoA synthase complex subunit beta [unclassified Methanoregula]OPX65066.1 MAG: Acetyl-CoA decarbonylase/synthase complex subunit beta 2 [Methanoregula sp. PtaB.Bin085]OPY32331.1 MAG: Acetyl-CoA decarbonylase/synthase complex subunit beta 2 [Methanoregula sp. PtaU1.Bin006]